MSGARNKHWMILVWLGVLAALPVCAQAKPPQAPDNDQTLRAMRDELNRSTSRLAIRGLEKPYYIEYRLLDLDIRNVSATFGSLLNSSTTRNRFMTVDVRVGDYQFDSSNFVSDEAFRGFLGSAGQVGIDRDYNSLRQDLWLATDQAYKEALDQISRKRAFLRSLTKPPEIADFSKIDSPVKLLDPHAEPDWTSRNWEEEARSASSVFKDFPTLYSTRVNYYMVYATYYLMTSEGTEIRVSRSFAAIEAGLDTQADDGMGLDNYYSFYAATPAQLPDSNAIHMALGKVASQLMALRGGEAAPDFVGPVLLDPEASGAVLAQLLAPSVSGARPPLSMLPMFDQMMDRVGARSEWSGRVGTRVLPTSVSLVDDPSAKDFKGQPLIGGYPVDDEGVRPQKVEIVQGGILRNLLMSRRPGPDFTQSNGHARSALLSDASPMSSNLFFQSTETVNAQDLRKKFLQLCKEDGHEWCIEVKRMDNPALASQRQEDFSESIAGMASGLSSGDRIPLVVYRVYVSDGHEELARGERMTGVNLRLLRNIAGIGDDSAVFNYMQNAAPGFAGTALGAFGNAQGGLPSSLVAPSLLLEEVEVRGARGGRQRPPLIPPPPLK
ncbi:MAG: metallopeptidase TldD-related protein [Candidatus Acidiferrales bacterium]